MDFFFRNIDIRFRIQLENFSFVSEEIVHQLFLTDFASITMAFYNFKFINISIHYQQYVLLTNQIRFYLYDSYISEVYPIFAYSSYSYVWIINSVFTNLISKWPNKFNTYSIYIEYSYQIIIDNSTFSNLNGTLNSPVNFLVLILKKYF